MEIPTNITIDDDKVKYLYRVLELLKLEHNEKGKLFLDGFLSEKEFRDYQKGEFKNKKDKIFLLLGPIREAIGMTQLDSPKMKLKYDGKAETKWDSEINLTTI